MQIRLGSVSGAPAERQCPFVQPSFLHGFPRTDFAAQSLRLDSSYDFGHWNFEAPALLKLQVFGGEHEPVWDGPSETARQFVATTLLAEIALECASYDFRSNGTFARIAFRLAV